MTSPSDLTRHLRDSVQVWGSTNEYVQNNRDRVAEFAQRFSFQLTYGRSPVPRRFSVDGISGPQIDNAYEPHERERSDDTAPGDWDSGEWGGTEYPEEEWRAHFFNWAISEAVHEALEWFREDGKILLDPHGPAELKIHDLCSRFASELLDLVEVPE